MAHLLHTAWSASVRMIWKTLTVKVLSSNSSSLYIAFLCQFFLSYGWYFLLIYRKTWVIVIANKILFVPSTPMWNIWHQGQKEVTQCYFIFTIFRKKYQSGCQYFPSLPSVWLIYGELWDSTSKGKQNHSSKLPHRTSELCWSDAMCSVLSCW